MTPLGIAEHDEAMDEVFELAHVARPRTAREQGERVRQKLPILMVLAVEPVEEDGGQDRDLLPSLAEWRHADLHDVQTIVEVFAELAAAQGEFQVSIGRGHDPGVDSDQFPAADARKLKILDHVEELRLKGQGEFADLVQVDSPLVRKLELSELSPVGAGEGSSFMAEEFGFQQLAGKGGTVHLDKRPVRSRGGRVNGPCHQILADPAFSSEEDGRVDGGDLFDELLDGPHLGAVAQQRGIVGEIALAERPLCLRGRARTRRREDRTKGGLEVARADRAAEDVEGRVLVCRARDRVRRVLHEEERDTRPAEPSEEARSEVAVGEIHQDEGRGEAPLHLQGIVGQISDDRIKPHSLHASTDARVISKNKGDRLARQLRDSNRLAIRSAPGGSQMTLGETYFPAAGRWFRRHHRPRALEAVS